MTNTFSHFYSFLFPFSCLVSFSDTTLSSFHLPLNIYFSSSFIFHFFHTHRVLVSLFSTSSFFFLLLHSKQRRAMVQQFITHTHTKKSNFGLSCVVIWVEFWLIFVDIWAIFFFCLKGQKIMLVSTNLIFMDLTSKSAFINIYS